MCVGKLSVQHTVGQSGFVFCKKKNRNAKNMASASIQCFDAVGLAAGRASGL